MKLLFVLILVLLASGCGEDKAQSAAENTVPYPDVPSGSGGGVLNANKNFAFLQNRFPSAVINPAPWAGFWWPYQSNGIASAAAKYDSANADSNGAASWERDRHGQGLGDVADWWGHCNGWAAAAMLTPEPRSTKSVGGQNFDISDRKALLTETFMEVTGDFLGTRVNSPDDRSSNAMRDITPAQFFLMITNVMGARGRAFVMDRFTGHEVWNHPTVAYLNAPVTREDYIGADPEFPNVHRVNVSTKIFWVKDNVDPDITTPAFDFNAVADVFESRTLRYEVWLDAAPQFDAQGKLTASGDVILTSSGVGGEWKNGSLPLVNSHPDYMWIPTGSARSSGFKNPNVNDAWVFSNMR